MGRYNAGDVIHHLFVVRDSGVLTNADALPTGALYKDGTVSADVVTVSLKSTGVYGVSVTAPALSHNADLHTVVDFSVGGQGQTVVFEDQIEVPAGAGVYPTAEEIADEVLAHAVVDAIANVGAVDRHSLGAVILLLTNSESVSSPSDQVNAKHPDTDVVIHSYSVTKGPACPVQSIT